MGFSYVTSAWLKEARNVALMNAGKTAMDEDSDVYNERDHVDDVIFLEEQRMSYSKKNQSLLNKNLVRHRLENFRDTVSKLHIDASELIEVWRRDDANETEKLTTEEVNSLLTQKYEISQNNCNIVKTKDVYNYLISLGSRKAISSHLRKLSFTKKRLRREGKNEEFFIGLKLK
jgi:hypothetical protein